MDVERGYQPVEIRYDKDVPLLGGVIPKPHVLGQVDDRDGG
jgi:hypothetical protein